MRGLAKAVLTLAAVLVAPLFVAAQVHADTITIHDLTEGIPTITQTGTSTHVNVVPCSGAACIGETLNFTIDAITPGAINPVTELNGQPFSFPDILVAPFGLTEPGFPPAGSSCGPDCLFFPPNSDTVYPQFQDPQTILVLFASDGDPANLGFCGHFGGAICVGIEDGTPQNMFTLGWANGASATIQIQSDVDDVVPEPSSLILLGSGLLGVTRRVRRRRAVGRATT